MAVRVGPYQRIVDFYWPEVVEAPKYIQCFVDFTQDRQYGEQNGNSPTALWDSSFAIGLQYLTSYTIGFDILPLFGLPFTVGGTLPPDQSQSFGPWEYVDQRTFVGLWWANTKFVADALTGPEITDGPTLSGAYARQETTITIGAWITPYSGSPISYTNVDTVRLAATFQGSLSFQTIENSELTSTKIFDFSGITTDYLGKSYTAYGLNFNGLTSYGYDISLGSIRLILKRDDM